MNDVKTKSSATAYYRLHLQGSDFAPRHWGNWLAAGLLWLFSLLPLPLSRLIGALIGLLLMAANAKRRNIVAINLKLCFPELSEQTRKQMLRRHYITSGQAHLDLGLLAWGSKWRLKRIFRVHGIEAYQKIAQADKPIILLAPHSVGMNFGGSPLALYHPMFSMYKTQRSPVVNWLLNKGRMRFGCQLVARDQGMRPVMRGLKQHIAFYYLPDEDLGPKHSIFAPFFGIQTATLPSLCRLAESTNALVVPVFTKLTWRGYEIYLRPPIENFPAGDKLADATRMNEVLEEGIRIAPEQYLWTFKIFRTRPEGEASLYAEKKRN